MHWIPRLIGIVPFGIGVTVLCFLWGTPFDEFGSPPLFFRVFGSFISLGFLLFGLLFFFGPSIAERQNGLLKHMQRAASDLQQSRTGRDGVSGNAPVASYDCPQCGAALGDTADVSPSGDAKCQYCRKWFNIHSPSR
jgi:hypothetical protein